MASAMFPSPPPTHNTLTSRERAHLRRSTNKLARVLGSTPQVVEYSRPSEPVHVQLSVNHKRSSSQDSHHSTSSTSSFSSTSTANHTLVSTISNTTTVAYRHPDDILASKLACMSLEPSSWTSKKNRRLTKPPTSRTSPTPTSPPETKADEVWAERFTNRRPPMLRLAVPSSTASARPSLDTIPASPFTICPPSISDMELSPEPTQPNFRIETEASVKRAKMERLKRKLGEGVPVDMVFPSGR
ncbi:hypothetical protein JAAARDRAFT_35824 [Jaapia argillacea MUCL 33604]|uniref:Uncharacterized protein n=1 Tax=Jaapia argillacea MUCL 33604 TaxID=933084 RepID=A0A067PTP3_9AGAM|nr:hypothetical protein JAAARDRAFT_35824 [Jaapia argillacea MUCL 33604]